MTRFARTFIGTRRLRVVLEEPADVADGQGGVARSYVPRITLWARLEPSPGRERAEADRAEAITIHQMTLRWRGDVTAQMRFSAAGRVFNILACHDPDGRRRDLVCRVEEARP